MEPQTRICRIPFITIFENLVTFLGLGMGSEFN